MFVVSSNAVPVRFWLMDDQCDPMELRWKKFLEKTLTIEGLSEDNSHPVQQAWIAEQVPQCGYCQSGQILTAVALLNRNTKPDEQTVNRTMNVLCRCGTYPRIRKAITKAGEIMEKQNA